MNSKEKSWFRAMFRRGNDVANGAGRNEPSLSEVLLMSVTMFAVHIFVVSRLGDYWDLVTRWCDNQSYLNIASIVKNWHLSTKGLLSQHFWGFPYAIAGLSKLFGIPDLAALVMISALSSLAVCGLVHRLYGGWVAAVFISINYEWILASVDGGSEPLFMCLLYASFLAARSDRWALASLLASLSTIVRPLGVFALLAFAVVLVWRTSYRKLALTTVISLAIGALYIIPVWALLGTPFENFIAYRSGSDMAPDQRWLGCPFVPLVSGYLGCLHPPRSPSLVLPPVWLALALVGVVVMWLPRYRQSFSPYRSEALFSSIYILFLASLNVGYVAVFLPRYLVPILPLSLLALRDWLPRDRRLPWAVAILSALLASACRVGFKNVFGFRLP